MAKWREQDARQIRSKMEDEHYSVNAALRAFGKTRGAFYGWVERLRLRRSGKKTPPLEQWERDFLVWFTQRQESSNLPARQDLGNGKTGFAKGSTGNPTGRSSMTNLTQRELLELKYHTGVQLYGENEDGQTIVQKLRQGAEALDVSDPAQLALLNEIVAKNAKLFPADSFSSQDVRQNIKSQHHHYHDHLHQMSTEDLQKFVEDRENDVCHLDAQEQKAKALSPVKPQTIEVSYREVKNANG